jgi:hypothetical protein
LAVETMLGIPFARTVNGEQRIARLDEADIELFLYYLDRAPDDLNASYPSSHEAVQMFDLALAREHEVRLWEVTDASAAAIRWVLDQMVLDGRELSGDLEALRHAVAAT